MFNNIKYKPIFVFFFNIIRYNVIIYPNVKRLQKKTNLRKFVYSTKQ